MAHRSASSESGVVANIGATLTTESIFAAQGLSARGLGASDFVTSGRVRAGGDPLLLSPFAGPVPPLLGVVVQPNFLAPGWLAGLAPYRNLRLNRTRSCGWYRCSSNFEVCEAASSQLQYPLQTLLAAHIQGSRLSYNVLNRQPLDPRGVGAHRGTYGLGRLICGFENACQVFDKRPGVISSRHLGPT